MRPRGVSLIAALWIVGLILTLTMASAGLAASVRSRLAFHKAEQAAAAMAESGADYAEAMVGKGRWTRATQFRSPDLDGGGWFEVTAAPSGGGWALRSTGCFGPARHTVTRRAP